MNKKEKKSVTVYTDGRVSKQGDDNLCLLLATINALKSPAEVMSFLNSKDPNDLSYIKWWLKYNWGHILDPDGTDGFVNGLMMTHIDHYLQHLVELGNISSFNVRNMRSNSLMPFLSPDKNAEENGRNAFIVLGSVSSLAEVKKHIKKQVHAELDNTIDRKNARELKKSKAATKRKRKVTDSDLRGKKPRPIYSANEASNDSKVLMKNAERLLRETKWTKVVGKKFELVKDEDFYYHACCLKYDGNNVVSLYDPNPNTSVWPVALSGVGGGMKKVFDRIIDNMFDIHAIRKMSIQLKPLPIPKALMLPAMIVPPVPNNVVEAVSMIEERFLQVEVPEILVVVGLAVTNEEVEEGEIVE